MRKFEALSLKELAFSHGKEVFVFCVKNDVIMSPDEWDLFISPDGVSSFDCDYFICVDGKRSPSEYAKAVIWMDSILFGLMI